jgi:RNA polymerase sigma-70 factor (ECF subfamily)
VSDVADIVQDILQGREKGAERLVAEYKDSLYAAALALCGNPATAEDLVSQTFEKVVLKIDTCRDADSFYGWMYAILLNCYRNSIRNKVSGGTAPVGDSGDVEGLGLEAVDSDSVVRAVDGAILRTAIKNLPPKFRDVLILHYFMDQSVPTIAKFLSVADGTVRSRLYYARLALSVRLGAALKKPAVVLTAAGFFMVAAFAATFMVSDHPQLAEVDEPVYVDDAPLSFEEGFEDSECLVPAAVVPCVAPTGDCKLELPATPDSGVDLKVSATWRLKRFQSSFKSVRSKPISSFNSTSANPVIVNIR